MAEPNPDFTRPSHVVGRYALYGRLAAGGMATVHLGRLLNSEEGIRTVAIKRLHPQFCKDPEFVAMFIDEARLAARIKHPNVVETLDILTMGQELLLVMEYIRGECFSKLLRAARRKGLEPSLGVVGRIASGMLHGLHAAHEACDDDGELLNVVHRDISPQNVMVGIDGVAKVLDFGVAKASARIQITRDGQMKGKLSYMSPEQLQGMPVDRRADVFAAGVVLWEALTRRRLFVGEDASEVLRKILKDEVPPPSQFAPDLGPELDAVVLRALSKDPDSRYQTAEEAAFDIERVVELASPRQVGEWIESVAGEVLGKRDHLLDEIERADADGAGLPVGGGAATDSDTFERIQSWAEREAARVVADDEEEIEIDPDEEEAFGEPRTQLDAAGTPSLDEEPRTEVDAAAALADGEDEFDSVVTMAHEPAFSAPEAVAPAVASSAVPLTASSAVPLTVAPAVVGSSVAARVPLSALMPVTPLSPVAPMALRRPSGGRRVLSMLLAAAAFTGLAAVVVVAMERTPLVRTSGALLPESPDRARAPVAVAAEPEPALAQSEPAADVVPVLEPSELAAVAEAEPPIGEPPTTAPVVAREEPATPKPVAKRIALTRPQKALPASYRRKKRGRAAKAAAKPEPRSSKRADACREPYYYDPGGIKRLKMECL